ncbi:50S ribosomal protein L22 [Candidatus Dojkabacteria bacterium HGW-Dojkabacteria-1]|uniref:Large ribosomal subunit protein uL22 n=1 Tax=Candidatus Dojkabacteria bacterium HGW-Dojkabacteria-1 TaxID=2013761 RepID=A0A2N2F313_9BACT|nr:ribosomal protein L22 [uncultured bacterium]PKN02557.1 MAG: 50S ribosomal protein L22 [Candidatus Dojkabacteria bacterium HGW-Dojkabacteria-1]
MEVKSTKVKVKNIAQSPQKLRLVADLVRGKDVETALDILQLTNRKGTKTLQGAILSGVANARDLFSVDKGELVISHISVDGAPSLKRVRFASKGRVSRITKRRSHINLELTVK